VLDSPDQYLAVCLVHTAKCLVRFYCSFYQTHSDNNASPSRIIRGVHLKTEHTTYTEELSPKVANFSIIWTLRNLFSSDPRLHRNRSCYEFSCVTGETPAVQSPFQKADFASHSSVFNDNI
jgi:hypothetical protein